MTSFIAHRGNPVDFRENTIPAFASAERLGADMIELDVQLSKDGQSVVIHDDTLHRLWNVDAAVADLTYAEILRVTGSHDYEIPLLSHVLDTVSLPVMIDVKYTDSVDSIVETLRRLNAVDRALITGGNVEAHRRMRKLLPTVDISLTWEDPNLPRQTLLDELRVSYFNPPWWLFGIWSMFGLDVVGSMHRRGVKVCTWTVDEEAVMWKLVELGVDAIITNRCGQLRSALDGKIPSNERAGESA